MKVSGKDILDIIPIEDVNSKRGAGRKTSCNSVLTQMLAEAIAGGLSTKDACDLLEISRPSFYNWLKRGEKIIEQMFDKYGEGWEIENAPESEHVFIEFFYTIKKAIPYRKAMLLNTIRKASVDQWQAAAWLAERLHPDEFGRKTKIEIQDNFKMELIRLIQENTITFEQVKNELGTNDAVRLFNRAGRKVPENI